MATIDIVADDVGTRIEHTVAGFTIGDDATAFVTFQPPSGSPTTKSASILTRGESGVIAYTTEDGLLSTAGDWTYQWKIVDGANRQRSRVQNMRVLPKLDT